MSSTLTGASLASRCIGGITSSGLCTCDEADDSVVAASTIVTLRASTKSHRKAPFRPLRCACCCAGLSIGPCAPVASARPTLLGVRRCSLIVGQLLLSVGKVGSFGEKPCDSIRRCSRVAYASIGVTRCLIALACAGVSSDDFFSAVYAWTGSRQGGLASRLVVDIAPLAREKIRDKRRQARPYGEER